MKFTPEDPDNIDPLSNDNLERLELTLWTWIITPRTQNDCITGSIQLKQLAAELR